MPQEPEGTSTTCRYRLRATRYPALSCDDYFSRSTTTPGAFVGDKNHPAPALGQALVANGHSVLFLPAFRVVQQLVESNDNAKRQLPRPVFSFVDLVDTLNGSCHELASVI